MTRIKQTAQKSFDRKVSRKALTVKVNNSAKKKIKMSNKKSTKKCRLKSENMYRLWYILWDWLLICIMTNLCTIHECQVTLQMWDMLLMWMLWDYMNETTYHSDDRETWILRKNVIMI